MPSSPSIARLPVQKVRAYTHQETDDDVAVEEPLEIRLQYGRRGARTEQAISITMRTPGNDTELATGFLFTEGIIPDATAVIGATTTDQSVSIHLREDLTPDMGRLQRHFYTSSSCGVCGKSSIDALRTICPVTTHDEDWQVTDELIYSLPALLRQQQQIFRTTGGLHAAGLFHRNGDYIAAKEDIGRHNALDKLIGHAFQHERLPLSDHILLLSGRACYELIQKAAMAGIRMVAAVSAPSSLAIRLAEEYNITLIGFLRDDRYNIYSRPERLIIPTTQQHA